MQHNNFELRIRRDCESTESTCKCDDTGVCRYNGGEPTCLAMGSGCDGDFCDGCNVTNWITNESTIWTVLNHILRLSFISFNLKIFSVLAFRF